MISPAWQRGLRELCVLGAVVVLLVPAARGHHEWLGWWPLWLLAMPLLACWVAHGMPLSGWGRPAATGGPVRSGSWRRVDTGKARRRGFGQAVTTGRSRQRTACGSVRGQ